MTPLRLLTAVCLACGVVASHAGEITFDTADGYNPFTSLSGQPGWVGAGLIWNVVPRESGVNDGQNVVSVNNPIGDQPFFNTRFPLTTDFLETPSTAIPLADQPTFTYSFELRSDAPPAVTTGFASSFLIKLFDDGEDGLATRYTLFDNGTIEIPQTGVGPGVVKDSNGDALSLNDAANIGRFITFEGEIDFATQTFTSIVDGVTQTTAGGSPTFNFQTPGQDDYGIVTLQRGSSTDSTFRQVSLDNIVLDNQAAAFPGDYNNDGTVDAADYTVYRDADAGLTTLQNETAAPLGVVNLLDYAEWANNFGNVEASAVGVPEPSTAIAAAGFGLAALVRRR